ncbi:hypothetical protein ACFWCB_19530 [Streptomyces sp. NPDC060048]|uniref:hypothetical protein n=1 Tax=unclassified Streptomyces TaxID=2593676 RepID=UPI0036AAE0CE
MQSDTPYPSGSDEDAALVDIRRAEVSLNSNTYPADVAERARAAVEIARQALEGGDPTAARAASALAIQLLADALR